MKIIFKVIKAGSGNDIYFERLSQALKQINIESVIEYYPKYFQYIPWALRFVNKKTPGDIIHSNVEYGWVFEEAGKPLYVTLHHNVFDKEFRKYANVAQKLFHDIIIKPNTHKSLRRATKIIAVSNYTKGSFIETFGEHPIEVIYNFIDTRKYKPQKVKSSDKRFKLLFVGNLIKRKGADLLPQIMSQLDPKEYVLYYTTGLRTKIPKSYNLPNMIPLGKLSEEELIEEYNKCDALLFPSRFEGFGYAVVEALACGKPIIAFSNSSIKELLIDKNNCYLAETNKVDEVIEFIKKSKKILNHLSELAKIIDERFEITVIIKKYENIYS